MSDWLPDDHLVYFIIDIVEDLDLAPIEGVLQEKDGRGTRPYAPQMMVALSTSPISSLRLSGSVNVRGW